MKKIILYIIEDDNTAQYRYRVRNVKERLETGEKYDVEIFSKSKINEARSRLKDIALVVILRQTAKDGVILNFINAAQKMGKKVVFDLDDLIFDYRYLLLLMYSTNSKNFLYWIGYFWGIRRIAKIVDGFIVTNDFLKDKIVESFRKPSAVIPNSLNQEQLEVSEECLKRKHSRKKSFRIGYFSGSPTHKKDFALIEKDILRFLEINRDAILEIVGYMSLSKRMQELKKMGRVKQLPIVDYCKLQEMIANVDVNIAPLLVNDFSNCKSELKFFEAAIVDTVTIASPTYVFKKVIKDGENGWLAETNQWYEKLEYVYNHRKENMEMAERARRYALRYYYGTEIRKKIEKAYDYLIDENGVICNEK